MSRALFVMTSIISSLKVSIIMFVTAVLFAILYSHFTCICGLENGGQDSNVIPVIIGHRGSAGVYPEHTTIAYEKGAEMGADYIECDVQVTKVKAIV